MTIKLIIKIHIFFLITFKIWASSCCGGGGGSSLIILGDNKREYSATFNHRNDMGSTDQNGLAYFNNQNITDETNRLTLEVKSALSDYWQGAIKTSFASKLIERNEYANKAQGASEIEGSLSYEFLPEYFYHPLKPRGFIYIRPSIPLSKGAYNSEALFLADAFGTGLYSNALGILFAKKHNNWTIKMSLEWIHLFGQHFRDSEILSYEKYTLPLGLSYAFNDWTLGINDTFNYTSQKKTTGLIQSTSQSESFFDLGLFVNYGLTREENLGISYSDSTLLGKSINSSLYRSVALNYTYALPL